MKRILYLITAVSLTACAHEITQNQNKTIKEKEIVMTDNKQAENPLFSVSTLPFEVPDFEAIHIEHYLPAFEQGIKEQLEEMERIAKNTDEPSFSNTILEMEKSGVLLTRVSQVFFNLTSAHTNSDLQAIQTELAPKMAAHRDNILLNATLFKRVEALYETREELGLDPSSLKLLEDTYRDFIRAGAKLTADEKQIIRTINERISELTTEFQRNLLTMTKDRVVIVEDVNELDGLGTDRIEAAKEAAEKRGLENTYLLGITNTTRVPILKNLKNRSLREKVWKASANRGIGEEGGIDNRPLVLELVELRTERVNLLGYDNYATFAHEPQTAQHPDNVLEMLSGLIPAVVKNSSAEAELIQEMMKRDGVDDDLKPWDWEYYAEKVRKEKYDINADEVRPYFELNRVLNDGVFYTMNRLFGVTFEERFDLPRYHPDVRVYTVKDEIGEEIGLFYADYFTRESKRGGAWMSEFVSQSGLFGKKPVVVNVLNIEPPADGEPALITFDNVTTLFHEMGHAVHGLFSDVYYPSQAGTSVPRDFVEFPSTFDEDWAIHPEVLANYAYHYETGEPIPDELLKKVLDAKDFNQGFDTQEYLSAAMLDLEWHLFSTDNIPDDVVQFEQKALEKWGLNNEAIPPRYKSPYFSHIFAGGYSANYYAYMWSEILAADAFAFMRDNGGLIRENGDRYREFILSKGGSDDAMELYRKFRNGNPDVKHLLQRRGLSSN